MSAPGVPPRTPLTLCPVFSSPGTTRFSGTYTITGGTGIYAGATGSGTSTMDFTFGSPANTFTSSESGRLLLGGLVYRTRRR